jgi:hypothetical protein
MRLMSGGVKKLGYPSEESLLYARTTRSASALIAQAAAKQHCGKLHRHSNSSARARALDVEFSALP